MSRRETLIERGRLDLLGVAASLTRAAHCAAIWHDVASARGAGAVAPLRAQNNRPLNPKLTSC
ncbi:MAG: hypothetical protein L0220_04645 [Acidobacteria bacterium]|nr:hypothetical protein [Acidobacteriota bacterium]